MKFLATYNETMLQHFQDVIVNLKYTFKQSLSGMHMYEEAKYFMWLSLLEDPRVIFYLRAYIRTYLKLHKKVFAFPLDNES